MDCIIWQNIFLPQTQIQETKCNLKKEKYEQIINPMFFRVLWAFYFHDPSNVQKQRQSTKQKYQITITNTPRQEEKKAKRDRWVEWCLTKSAAIRGVVDRPGGKQKRKHKSQLFFSKLSLIKTVVSFWNRQALATNSPQPTTVFPRAAPRPPQKKGDIWRSSQSWLLEHFVVCYKTGI